MARAIEQPAIEAEANAPDWLKPIHRAMAYTPWSPQFGAGVIDALGNVAGVASLIPGPTSLEGKLISSNSHSRTGTYLQKSVLDHFVPFGLTWVVARGPGKA